MTTPQERRATLLAELGTIHTNWSDEVCQAAAANPVDVSQYEDGWEHYADVAATPEQEADFHRRTARIRRELQAITDGRWELRAAGPVRRTGLLYWEQPRWGEASVELDKRYSPTPEQIRVNRLRLRQGVRFYVVPFHDIARLLLKEITDAGQVFLSAGDPWKLVPAELMPHFPLAEPPLEVTPDFEPLWWKLREEGHVFLEDLKDFRVTRGESW